MLVEYTQGVSSCAVIDHYIFLRSQIESINALPGKEGKMVDL